jgi:hypothetical protein
MDVYESNLDDRGRPDLFAIKHQEEEYDLVFSPDDHGWYFLRVKDRAVSKEVFKGKKQALKALNNNTIRWEK